MRRRPSREGSSGTWPRSRALAEKLAEDGAELAAGRSGRRLATMQQAGACSVASAEGGAGDPERDPRTPRLLREHGKV